MDKLLLKSEFRPRSCYMTIPKKQDNPGRLLGDDYIDIMSVSLRLRRGVIRTQIIIINSKYNKIRPKRIVFNPVLFSSSMNRIIWIYPCDL
jgi:hypothetical protein